MLMQMYYRDTELIHPVFQESLSPAGLGTLSLRRLFRRLAVAAYLKNMALWIAIQQMNRIAQAMSMHESGISKQQKRMSS